MQLKAIHQKSYRLRANAAVQSWRARSQYLVRSICGLALLAALAPAQTRLFMSGFEGNSTLSAIPSSATGDNYQHFSGSDNTTGYTWPMNFWGASSTVTGIHAIVGGTNNVSTYINNYIDTLTGPTGS